MTDKIRKHECPHCGQDLRLPPDTFAKVSQIRALVFSMMSRNELAKRALNLTYEILEAPKGAEP